jgi:hypothetical protein
MFKKLVILIFLLSMFNCKYVFYPTIDPGRVLVVQEIEKENVHKTYCYVYFYDSQVNNIKLYDSKLCNNLKIGDNVVLDLSPIQVISNEKN